MKRIFGIAALVALCASGIAQTTLTQVWKVDAQPSGRDWFTTNGSPVRSAKYNPVTDHVTVISRDPYSTTPQMVILDAATGDKLSTVALETTGGFFRVPPETEEYFAVMKHAVAADGVTFITNLSTDWSTSTLTTSKGTVYPDTMPFKIYRMATEGGALQVAYEGFRPELYTTVTAQIARIGDSLDVTGSGNQTEIWLGIRRTIGPHLVRFTTTDGVTFAPTRFLTIPGTWATSTAVPTYRGLSVTGTGDNAIIWIKEGAHVIRKINAVTGAIEQTIDTSANAAVHSQAGIKLIQEFGGNFLALVPANPANENQRSGYVMNIDSAANPIVAKTEWLTAALVPPPANGNGTGSIDYDATRKNLIYCLSGNSVSAHQLTQSIVTAASDWQLLD